MKAVTKERVISFLRRQLRKLKNVRFKGVNVYTIGSYGITVFKDVDSLVSDLNQFRNLSQHIEEGRRLYAVMSVKLSGKVSPIKFDSGEELGTFLYAFILEKKPKCVVETGVANGLTTNLIMTALDTYGGELHSFDVNPDCQNVYSGNGKWKFHLLDRNYKKQVNKVVNSLEGIDLWIHDSDHSYSWQSFEYALALNRLKGRDGFLVSDDIDCTTAFGKTLRAYNLPGWAVFDSRKFFGITQTKS